MKELVTGRGLGVFFLVLVASLFCLSPVFAAQTVVYTKYNIHVQDKLSRSGKHVYHASYAGYVNPGAGHLIIPAGSKVTVLKKNRKLFRFRVEKDSKVVNFQYHQPRMGMSIGEYIEKITSSKPVSLSRFSSKDKKGIAAGKAYVGMSKKGVMAALGYPPTHRTPSLDASSWIYWANRFRTIGVDFDNNGRVKAIR